MILYKKQKKIVFILQMGNLTMIGGFFRNNDIKISYFFVMLYKFYI